MRAKRPNRPGTALVLADGQHLANVNIRLTRGSVISGVLVDQNGERAPTVLMANLVQDKGKFLDSGDDDFLATGEELA